MNKYISLISLMLIFKKLKEAKLFKSKKEEEVKADS